MLASGVGYTVTIEERLPRTISLGSVNSKDLEPFLSSRPPVGVTSFTPATNDANCASPVTEVSLACVPLMAPI